MQVSRCAGADDITCSSSSSFLLFIFCCREPSGELEDVEEEEEVEGLVSSGLVSGRLARTLRMRASLALRAQPLSRKRCSL